MLPNKIPIACPIKINLGSIEYSSTESIIEEQITIQQETIIGRIDYFSPFRMVTINSLKVTPFNNATCTAIP